MTAVWTWHDEALSFDICDGGCIAKLTDALGVLNDAEEQDAENGKQAYCRMVSRFFDTLFGVGAGARICGEDEDRCSAAFLSFARFVRDQLEELRQIREEAEEKYLAERDGMLCGIA